MVAINGGCFRNSPNVLGSGTASSTAWVQVMQLASNMWNGIDGISGISGINSVNVSIVLHL